VGLDLNPDMLEVAREAAVQEGAPIEWYECPMESLPFPDRSFDLVLCQQGLQFVEDRERALAEMQRVLDDGGRVGLSLWLGLEEHPFYATFNEAIERRLGVPALATPFSLGDAEDLVAALARAGFEDVVVERRSMEAREPDPDDFVKYSIEVITAAIPSVQGLDPAARRELTHEIKAEMEPHVRAHTRGNEVVLPFHAHLFRARRSG
jgi:SAM-dependent methyltransferase